MLSRESQIKIYKYITNAVFDIYKSIHIKMTDLFCNHVTFLHIRDTHLLSTRPTITLYII